MSEAEILVERHGRAGILTLNRPKALNALTPGMVASLRAALEDWRDDEAVTRVILRAAGDKAFCAGGDIRQVYEQGKAGDPKQAEFFADEYRLNIAIKRYPKPIVSLIDGIVMGGGVGISAHGSHRVGSERTTFAMPETGIGFFPDVGGSYLLPRMPDETGMMLALSAGRLKQADALWTGVLTHAVNAADLEALQATLCEADDIDAALAEAAGRCDPGPAPLAARAARISEIFSATSVAAILAGLEAEAATAGENGEWAGKVLSAISSKSPTSLEISFEQLRRGGALEFEDCMTMEFRIVSRILKGHDFYEGVRALIVDKDNQPVWQPSRLADVARDDVLAHFEAPEGGDLEIR
uniref:enoyl-CoA hydratase/isomerase family protein n=1 Tax=Stappia sp. TaxID=1870903 RepID=UPI003BABD46E